MDEVWANAVPRDGKLIFWYTGSKANDVMDFNKDFYYSGLNMMDELKSGKYTLEQKKMYSTGNEAFLKEAPEFYKQFELCENFVGDKPY